MRIVSVSASACLTLCTPQPQPPLILPFSVPRSQPALVSPRLISYAWPGSYPSRLGSHSLPHIPSSARNIQHSASLSCSCSSSFASSHISPHSSNFAPCRIFTPDFAVGISCLHALSRFVRCPIPVPDSVSLSSPDLLLHHVILFRI